VKGASSSYCTAQEAVWAGEFGDDYTSRNQGDLQIAANVALFARILSRTEAVHSAIEFGANVGLNLLAIRRLLPGVELAAVEINRTAVNQLESLGGISVYGGSMLDFEGEVDADLALAKGVLIHINPEMLPRAYDVLFRAGRRYVCLAEYYNPVPVEVKYRGHEGILFKRDFCGEMLDRFHDLTLVDYGFVYHRDPQFPQDDLTWFLLAKNKR
jgi:pseudaminic acid biosynthesis-associated methylase